jgi:hypothetical protein
MQYEPSKGPEAASHICELLSVAISGGKPKLSNLTVRLPAGRMMSDLALSPDGTTLAWLVDRKNEYVIDLATSRLDGTDRKQIGSMKYDPPGPDGVTAERCSYCPDHLMWRPDG